METFQENRHPVALEALARYGHERKALLPVLHFIKDHLSYIPEDAIRTLALEMHLSPVEIQGVITFYSYLPLVRKGKHVLHVCGSMACLLKGADENLKFLCELLGIAPGETTADQQFSLEESHCIGWCHRAPAMLVGHTPAVEVDKDLLNRIVKDLKKDEPFAGNWQEEI
ncbi:MAG: NAD(P)H-dependent oxidoreductase subunit E [Spirochaetales bacterium]|nr:NAD(P)H-dependent oxidoreductase subunit E [Spirochaetales bacterium]